MWFSLGSYIAPWSFLSQLSIKPFTHLTSQAEDPLSGSVTLHYQYTKIKLSTPQDSLEVTGVKSQRSCKHSGSTGCSGPLRRSVLRATCCHVAPSPILEVPRNPCQQMASPVSHTHSSQKCLSEIWIMMFCSLQSLVGGSWAPQVYLASPKMMLGPGDAACPPEGEQGAAAGASTPRPGLGSPPAAPAPTSAAEVTRPPSSCEDQANWMQRLTQRSLVLGSWSRWRRESPLCTPLKSPKASTGHSCVLPTLPVTLLPAES